MIWKQFTHLGNFPPELKARFNSFLTTEFDDSLSVEMQLRSIIKWCQGNFKTVDTLIDFINDISNWLKQFETDFDTKLEDSVISVLSEWQASGKLDIVISEALQWQLDDYIATNEQDKLSLTAQLQQTEQALSSQLKDIMYVVNTSTELQTAIDNPTITNIGLKPFSNIDVSKIDIKRNGITINGNGATLTKTSDNKMINLLEGIKNITIKNINFEMGSVYTSSNSYAIYGNKNTNITVENCTFNGGGFGVYLTNTVNATIRDNTSIGANYWGIMVVGCDGLKYHRNTVSGCRYDGLKVGGDETSDIINQNIDIRGNECFDNTRDGLDIALNSGKNIRVHNNYFHNNKLKGIDIKILAYSEIDTVFKSIIVTDNTLIDNLGQEISMQASNFILKDALISNNNILYNSLEFSQHTAIKCEGLRESVIENNTMKYGLFGLRLMGVKDCVTANNKLFNVSKPIQLEKGINITDTPCTNNTIIDNYVNTKGRGSSGTGYMIGTMDNETTGNVVRNNTLITDEPSKYKTYNFDMLNVFSENVISHDKNDIGTIRGTKGDVITTDFDSKEVFKYVCVKTGYPAEFEGVFTSSYKGVVNIGYALPQPSNERLGQMFLLQGGTSISDSLNVCIKNADGVYEWVTL